MLLLLIGTITCFLDGPFVVIWIRGLGLGLPLTMLLTLSIYLVFKVGKDSLILSMSEVLAICLEACIYDLVGFEWLVVVLLSLKYFEIVLTSFLDFVRSRERGAGEAFLIDTETGFAISFLLLLGMTLGVDLDNIFALRVLALLSIWRVSYLASYTNDMKFQIAFPMPSKSLRSLTSLPLTCLLAIYLDMKFKESLILFKFDAKCSIEP